MDRGSGLARRGERRVCTRGSPAYARSRDAGGRFGVLTEQRAHKRYRTSTGVSAGLRHSRASACHGAAALRNHDEKSSHAQRKEGRGNKFGEVPHQRVVLQGHAGIGDRRCRRGLTELALGDSRARGADVVEGERDGGPRPEAERRCRLVVAERQWNSGTTAAPVPCSNSGHAAVLC